MSRTLLQGQPCRHSLLDTFTALAGLSISAQPARASIIRPCRPSIRTLHATPCRRKPLEEHHSSTDSDFPPPAPPTANSTTSSIPWYLQVSPPTPPAPSSSLQASYDIPAVPEDSPPLLQPLLEHLSNTIGLSHLSLLDLRSLSPPAALGSNLLMIIGTARSYKHLNVSADRLCRFLRTKYKLRPYADGLMGRQQLKLKLRRRARRMRLASKVGRMDEVANGKSLEQEVTTGWVCVNVGVVPDQVAVDSEGGAQVQAVALDCGLEADNAREDVDELEEECENDLEEEDTYVGFGSATTSPRIVVQMFTEDKRIEMDLEGLWDFRQSRREAQSWRLDDVSKKQESVWREKLREPVLNLGGQGDVVTDPLRDAEEEDLESETEKGKGEDGVEEDIEEGEGKGTRIEQEIDDPDAREEEGEEKPMGGIGAS